MITVAVVQLLAQRATWTTVPNSSGKHRVVSQGAPVVDLMFAAAHRRPRHQRRRSGLVSCSMRSCPDILIAASGLRRLRQAAMILVGQNVLYHVVVL